MANKETPIQVLLALPPIKIGDLDGVESVSDIIELLAKGQRDNAVEQELEAKKRLMEVFSLSLDRILNDIQDPFQKASALRDLAQTMRKYCD